MLEALCLLELVGEMSLDGRWVTLRGERCPVYVIETGSGEFFTWCDDPLERTVKGFLDPCAAIVAGMQRAARAGTTPSETLRMGDWTFPDE